MSKFLKEMGCGDKLCVFLRHLTLKKKRNKKQEKGSSGSVAWINNSNNHHHNCIQSFRMDSTLVTGVSGEDLQSLLFHFLDEFLYLFSVEPFLICRVSFAGILSVCLSV